MTQESKAGIWRRVGAAVALSPRYLAVMAEAWRFTRQWSAELTVLHAGVRTGQNEALFRQAFSDLGIPSRTGVLWDDRQPSEAVLRLAREARLDVLVAGALDRQSENKHFLGGVAQSLICNPPCSVMLFTNPNVDDHPRKTMVIATDFSAAARKAFQQGIVLARITGIEMVHVLSVVTPFMEARFKQEGHPATRDAMQDLLTEHGALVRETGIKTEEHLLDATTGYAAYEFVTSVHADMLVVPARRRPRAGRSCRCS